MEEQDHEFTLGIVVREVEGKGSIGAACLILATKFSSTICDQNEFLIDFDTEFVVYVFIY